MSEIKTEFLLRGDGLVRRETRETPIGDARIMLSLNVKEEYIAVRDAGVTSWLGPDMKKMQLPWSLVMGRKKLYIVSMPPTLPLLTSYRHVGNDRALMGEPPPAWCADRYKADSMRPVWALSDNPKYILPPNYMYPWDLFRKDRPWLGKLVLVSVMMVTNGRLDAYLDTHLAMYCNKGFYIFNYPNQFDDGKMCLGETGDSVTSMIGAAQSVLCRLVDTAHEVFLRIPCSNHLMTVVGKYHQWNMQGNPLSFNPIDKNMADRVLRPISTNVFNTVYDALDFPENY